MKTCSKNPILLALLLSLTSLNAFGFDKEVHRELTRKVIAEYNHCANHLGRSPVEESDAEQVALYAEMEDKKPLIPRALNWHFYDALRDTPDKMPNRLLLARTHLHHIFDVRVQKLYDSIKKDDQTNINKRTGRVLHYIEDVAVPAHVAPIYHAAPGDNWFQKLIVANEPDEFDSIPSRYASAMDLRFSLSECEELSKVDGTLQDILVNLAEDTRNQIRQPLDASSSETFQDVFWDLRQKGSPKVRYAGFVGYGSAKSTGFNPANQVCTSGETNVCINFFKGRYKALLRSSVKALMLIESMHMKTAALTR